METRFILLCVAFALMFLFAFHQDTTIQSLFCMTILSIAVECIRVDGIK